MNGLLLSSRPKNGHLSIRKQSWTAVLALTILLISFSTLPAKAQSSAVSASETTVTVVNEVQTPEGPQTTIQVNVSQDAFLSSNYPDTNFGDDSNLRLGWGNDGFDALRIVIQFDINPIPANAVINQATLNIYQWDVTPSNDGSSMGYRAQYMRTAWSEGGVTWNNANYLGGDALPMGNVDPSIGWKQVDVTALVKTWASGARPNYGLIVTGDETPSLGRERDFYSRQGGNAPYIQLTYTQQCDTIPPTSSVNALPQYSPGDFPVTWSAVDHAPPNCTPSGVANYDVNYRINGGTWQSWKNQTESTTNHFKNWAGNGDFVEIRARATDHAGNVEPFGNPQASTTVDTEAPLVTVTPLPAVTDSQSFVLSWSGSDDVSGVANYDVQFRENGGAWQYLLEETTLTSFQITGAELGVTYDFQVRATDNVGNSGQWPDQPQATTLIADGATATVLPFSPNLINSSSPVTTSFTVNWEVTGDTEAVSTFEIYLQFNNGAMQLWQSFVGSVLSAQYSLAQSGLGDGAYGFAAIAIDNQGNRQPAKSVADAIILVDLADRIQPSSYLPGIYNALNTSSE